MAKYHMHKAEREITDSAIIAEILKAGKYAVIAMCRENEPYVVTLSYGYDAGQSCLYFHTAPAGLKLDFIRENPEVCATVIEDGGYDINKCSHRYGSAVLRGTMSVVVAEAEKLHGMEVLAWQLEDDPAVRMEKVRRLNSAEWGRLTILRLDIRETTGKAGW